ncbi:MAG: hypothetical protein IPK44_24255 [Candidatus Accumulibacter sp.]|uniref:hypothetical protein n=1 Tax=Accumulibacter sp. TaxID=2053492 RepID=UPI00258AA850|nr:hypothetical protein [Accumulibacter sp.]MBK8117403.1 hypothetical protein [Accumulibacter sp.]
MNRRNDELKKAANYAVGGMVGEGSTIQQSLGMIGGPRYDVGGDNAPVWDDGTRRDGLTPEQAQQLKSERPWPTPGHLQESARRRLPSSHHSRRR